MEDFLEAIGEMEVSDAFREGIRLLAEKHDFRPPPKR
jgi:hypothetical protein